MNGQAEADLAASSHHVHHLGEQAKAHHSLPPASTPTRHQNSLHKRSAGGISPPDLFLRIFMDYSSPIEDGGGGGSDRRRAHRSFRITESDDPSAAQQQQTKPKTEQNSTAPILLRSEQDSADSDEGEIPTNTTSSTSSSSSTATSSPVCPVGHFGCLNDPTLCVPQSAVCNGKPECPDASDEYKCGKVL